MLLPVVRMDTKEWPSCSSPGPGVNWDTTPTQCNTGGQILLECCWYFCDIKKAFPDLSNTRDTPCGSEQSEMPKWEKHFRLSSYTWRRKADHKPAFKTTFLFRVNYGHLLWEEKAAEMSSGHEKVQPGREQLGQWKSVQEGLDPVLQAAGYVPAHQLLLRGGTWRDRELMGALQPGEVSSNSRAFVKDAGYKLLPTG